ncbi:hypothetical protein KK488_10850 [Sphingobium sp. H33]|uniref:Uncharacterized protein n=2 Tax=Sphingobium nicotianae TaxID=2782607 RepID=A0A9X1DCL8_9SPHN|nr:hypothetical protein [Sphingobium nicotianae]
MTILDGRQFPNALFMQRQNAPAMPFTLSARHLTGLAIVIAGLAAALGLF